MSNSYRIRTQIGVDKSIKLLLDQDFEQLEILSLKILSNQIYNRQCSDYGVIVGRITANNGFGLPNCKVSLFIPLSNQDEDNPVISTLYPYKSLSEVNEDGYRYNLLPYTKSYSNHVPTGSFPDREDALVDTNVIEVYDKYYKFTTQTNDSGDYMIFGVPLGSQTIHVDIDLSDMGEFSLSPQDLIRSGRATESQVAGSKFKSSSNLGSLPQILSFNRIINVDPFWGETDVCSIGITRTDFDITEEANINITPTATFMGSIISSNDDQYQRTNCKPKLKQGDLCNLVTGAGEILAIRQTIQQDSQGRPILEVFDLDSGGQVIDENGTWLVDVPMNLDYVTTNEFGDRVISNDPEVGIPTRGKYRFKIKWNQSPKLSEPIKRAYFLVPNIREYGWDSLGNNDPLRTVNPVIRDFALKSYAFSLDWNDYTDPQTAIDCEDFFYQMSFNKVYTVTQLLDQYRKGYLPNRTISIRNILDDACESENVKFPTNDAVYRFDLIYLVFIILLYIARPILYILLIVSHLVASLLWFFGFPQWRRIANLRLPNLSYPDCDLCECNEGGEATGPGPSDFQSAVDIELNRDGYLTPLWSFSQYSNRATIYENGPGGFGDQRILNRDGSYEIRILRFGEQQLISGQPYDPTRPSPTSFAPQMFDLENGKKIFTTSIPIFERLNLFNTKAGYFDGRINKLWNQPVGNWLPSSNTPTVRTSYNPWGGGNRIRVSFRPTLNGYPVSPSGVPDWNNVGINQPHHFDNVIVLMVKPEKLSEFSAGKLITFQSSELSSDRNLTGQTTVNQFNNNATTGITINQGQSNINVTWAHYDGTGDRVTTYLIDQGVDDAQFCKYPMDVEYFQVITGMTVGEYQLKRTPPPSGPRPTPPSYNPTQDYNGINYPGTLPHALFTRINIIQMDYDNGFDFSYRISPAEAFEDFDKQGLVFLVRGVDPYSTRGEVEYDLSTLWDAESPSYRKSQGTCTTPGCIVSKSQFIIRGDNYKLNIPINGGIKNVRHTVDLSVIDPDTNKFLYHPSYHFSADPTNFLTFNSSLPNYYSLLDTSTPWNYLTRARGLDDTTNNSTSTSFLTLDSDYSSNYNPQTPFNYPNEYTKQLRNAFQVEFRRIYVSVPLRRWQPLLNSDQFLNVLQSWRSPNVFYRSYLSNQVFEGGTFMNQVLCLNGSNPCTLGPDLDSNADKPRGVSYYYAPAYLLYNNSYQYKTAMINQGRIIMRSDRLPISTSYIENLENVYPLFSNPRFTIYSIPDDGEGAFFSSTSQPIGSPTFGSELQSLDDRPEGIPVLDTFTCSGLVPLGCYEANSNEISVAGRTDRCYGNGGNGKLVMEKGCYVLITQPFVTLINGKDLKLLSEWTNRIQITFAACRNVWSHMFTNNWINGTLYAFSFKNETFFDSNNRPISKYCTDTMVLHPTNNFYYRSSPYFSGTTVQSPRFVGAEPPNNGAYGGNERNLKFPTTIVDLGPRTDYTQELVYTDEYDGYVMNRLSETTYKDVSEILNLLIINRLTNNNFIQDLLGGGGANVLKYFDNRGKNFVDGDYAQMISINSELGVFEFEAANYPPVGGPNEQDPIYFVDTRSDDPVFGIFFSSDSQTRDFISPKRTIINPLATPNSNCAFSNFYVYSQEVPFYQWEIEDNKTPRYNNIFGSQSNDWYTDTIPGTDSFFSKQYQSLDRLDPSSRYFRTNTSNIPRDFKGYIYSFDNNPLSPNYNEYNPQRSSWAQNGTNDKTITVGSPFYFYFGLKKGKTAWDRFIKKWINFENITE